MMMQHASGQRGDRQHADSRLRSQGRKQKQEHRGLGAARTEAGPPPSQPGSCRQQRRHQHDGRDAAQSAAQAPYQRSAASQSWCVTDTSHVGDNGYIWVDIDPKNCGASATVSTCVS